MTDRTGRIWLLWDQVCRDDLGTHLNVESNLFCATSGDGIQWSRPRRLPVSSLDCDTTPILQQDRRGVFWLVWVSSRDPQSAQVAVDRLFAQRRGVVFSQEDCPSRDGKGRLGRWRDPPAASGLRHRRSQRLLARLAGVADAVRGCVPLAESTRCCNSSARVSRPTTGGLRATIYRRRRRTAGSGQFPFQRHTCSKRCGTLATRQPPTMGKVRLSTVSRRNISRTTWAMSASEAMARSSPWSASTPACLSGSSWPTGPSRNRCASRVTQPDRSSRPWRSLCDGRFLCGFSIQGRSGRLRLEERRAK